MMFLLCQINYFSFSSASLYEGNALLAHSFSYLASWQCVAGYDFQLSIGQLHSPERVYPAYVRPCLVNRAFAIEKNTVGILLFHAKQPI